MCHLQASHIFTMDFILFVLFVFTVRSLATKMIPDIGNKNEALDMNAGSLEKPGPVLNSSVQHDTSVITKRGASGEHGSDRWVKMNNHPVCFGAKDNQFGRFHAPHDGNMAAVKLVHLYGYVSCDNTLNEHWSYWGCGVNPSSSLKDLVGVALTTEENRIFLPPSQFITTFQKWSKIPGYDSLSPELVISSFVPYKVRPGQELRVWFTEDLLDESEADNDGKVCCDVYGLYV